MRILPVLLMGWVTVCRADLTADVRAALKKKEPAGAEQLVRRFQAANGATPEMILGLSWLGRGAVDDRRWDDAERFAVETRRLVEDKLRTVSLDSSPSLANGLGNAIDVEGYRLAAQGGLSECIAFLNQELKTWYDTSIRTRIQKTIHVLTLEGKPAPALEAPESIGGAAPSLAELRGKPVLLFFWAHWCSDCKAEGPILERIQKEYGPHGLVLVGPTRRYGYVGTDTPAGPAEEFEYMTKIRKERFGGLAMSVPVSEENFKKYGSSSSPTLVLIDAAGIVRLYQPGTISFEELAPRIGHLTGMQN